MCDPQSCSPQVKRIQRELEIDPTLPMLDAVHAAEAMLHWDFTQLDAAPLRVRIEPSAETVATLLRARAGSPFACEYPCTPVHLLVGARRSPAGRARRPRNRGLRQALRA